MIDTWISEKAGLTQFKVHFSSTSLGLHLVSYKENYNKKSYIEAIQANTNIYVCLSCPDYV